MYQDAVIDLIRAADQVAQFRADLASFGDTLAGKKWGQEVVGPIADIDSRLVVIEGDYRDLAGQMKHQGSQGQAAYDQAPWVPGPEALGDDSYATTSPQTPSTPDWPLVDSDDHQPGGLLATEPVPTPVQQARALWEAYQRGHTVEATLTGGQNARSVELVRLSDGSLAVRKQVTGFQSETEAVDAYLAGLVAGALDIDHTATAILDDKTVLSRFVPGISGADRRREADEIDGAGARLQTFELERLVHLPGGREIALLDFLSEQIDRNDNNFNVAEVAVDGRTFPTEAVYPLDHDFAMFTSSRPVEDVELHSPFSQAHMHCSHQVRDNNTPPLPVAAGELVSPFYGTELEPIRARLQELEPEFAAHGASAKHEFMMRRLAMLTALTYSKPTSTSVGAASVEDLDGFTTVEGVFEYGYCHALALAVNERTGWPVVGLRARGSGDSNHYLVRRPDGMLVDVRGARTEAAVLRQWDGEDGGYYTVRECEADFLWREVERGDMEDPADVWQLAHGVAATVAKQ